MRLTTTFAATALACAALVAAGCGDDDKTSDDGASAVTTPAPETTSSETTATETTGGGIEIKMKDIQFDPKDQTVKVGEKVTWTNEDSVDHNVVATEGGDFESDTFGEDGSFDFTPSAAGTIKYTCTLHPGMDGALEVTE